MGIATQGPPQLIVHELGVVAVERRGNQTAIAVLERSLCTRCNLMGVAVGRV